MILVNFSSICYLWFLIYLFNIYFVTTNIGTRYEVYYAVVLFLNLDDFIFTSTYCCDISQAKNFSTDCFLSSRCITKFNLHNESSVWAKGWRDDPVIFHLSYCINSLLHLIKASLTVQFVSVIVFFQFNFCSLNKNALRHSGVFYISTASAHVDLALQ